MKNEKKSYRLNFYQKNQNGLNFKIFNSEKKKSKENFKIIYGKKKRDSVKKINNLVYRVNSVNKKKRENHEKPKKSFFEIKINN